MDDFTPVKHKSNTQPPPPKSLPPKNESRPLNGEVRSISIAGTTDKELLKADKNHDGQLDDQELIEAFDNDNDQKLSVTEISKMTTALSRGKSMKKRKDGEGVHPTLWTSYQAFSNVQKPLYIIFYFGLIYFQQYQ